MNWNYWICVAAAAAASFGWLAVRLRRRGMKAWSAALGLALSALLGAAAGKLLYVGLLFQQVWMRFGASALWRMNAGEFSFFGGALGVVAAMALTARLTGQKTKPFLSVFAPCGALLAAGFRAAEYFQGILGLSIYKVSPAFARFPFAVANWGYWYFAVFSAEAIVALIVSLVFWLRRPEDKIPGLRMERTAFYLCVPQIFFERLRSYSLRWGFVRIEQVLCAAAAVGLIVYGCIQVKRLRGMKRFWPVLGSLACVAVIVGVEFALDKWNFSIYFWYGVMLLALFAMGVMEYVCYKRRLLETTEKS